MEKYDVLALGELLIDFTENGVSGQGNPVLEANPGAGSESRRSALQCAGNAQPAGKKDGIYRKSGK